MSEVGAFTMFDRSFFWWEMLDGMLVHISLLYVDSPVAGVRKLLRNSNNGAFRMAHFEVFRHMFRWLFRSF
jgi:hypothetical protein